MRLSIPTTEKPRSSRYWQRWEPMNPAAPVTRALGIRPCKERSRARASRGARDSLMNADIDRARPCPAVDQAGARGASTARPGRSWASVRMLLAEAAEEGQDQDLHVEQQRPVLDVVQVVLDPLLDRRVAAPAVDLGPAGDAALDPVAQHVLRDALLELLDEGRPLGARPHQAHV